MIPSKTDLAVMNKSITDRLDVLIKLNLAFCSYQIINIGYLATQNSMLPEETAKNMLVVMHDVIDEVQKDCKRLGLA